jgi:hypothetical protein
MSALLIWLSCSGAELDSTDESLDTKRIQEPLGQLKYASVKEPEPAPSQLPDLEIRTQKTDIEVLTADLAALEFFLEDKKALETGRLPRGWRQPPIEVYKAEPGCHAPIVHGVHTPRGPIAIEPTDREAFPPLGPQ